MEKETARKMWDAHNVILDNIFDLLELTYGKIRFDDADFYVNEQVLDWGVFLTYQLPTPLNCKDCEILTLLVFGDCTLEIVTKEEEEPLNWSYISVDSLTALANYLNELNKQ